MHPAINLTNLQKDISEGILLKSEGWSSLSSSSLICILQWLPVFKFPSSYSPCHSFENIFLISVYIIYIVHAYLYCKCILYIYFYKFCIYVFLIYSEFKTKKNFFSIPRNSDNQGTDHWVSQAYREKIEILRGFRIACVEIKIQSGVAVWVWGEAD